MILQSNTGFKQEKISLTEQEQLLPLEMQMQIIAYKEIARGINFKDKCPTLGKNINSETIRGFKSRFYNWSRKMLHLHREAILNKKASNFSKKALFNTKDIMYV